MLVGATHCVALYQYGRTSREGEAVPRPYKYRERCVNIGAFGAAALFQPRQQRRAEIHGGDKQPEQRKAQGVAREYLSLGLANIRPAHGVPFPSGEQGEPDQDGEEDGKPEGHGLSRRSPGSRPRSLLTLRDAPFGRSSG